MRTLCVFHTGGVGGPQRSLTQAVEWLASRGEVQFVVPEQGATTAQYAAYGPGSVRPYSALTYARGPLEGVRLARRAGREVRMFRRELRERRPDLVIAVTTVLPALVVAARLERVPCVVYAAELHAPRRRAAGRALVTGTAGLAQGIVACSAAVASQFPRRPRRPLAVAYPPVGEEYAGGDREAGRARLGIVGGEPCLLVVGSISPGRGQDVAIGALASIRQRLPGARLAVVGAPHARAVDLMYASELRSLAARCGVEDAVVLAGTAESMADVYAAADIVLNPARSPEGFGRVAAEALRAGRPVVASRVGAIPEVVRDGIDALLVEPADEAALASAVVRLAEDRALAERLVESGRQRVLERFGREQDLAAWKSVVDAALR
ncbi:MAG: hypothetical protein QOE69_1488 [Thermoleophilaceae bacterium]|jgi:glycosyltransferase involved in cell wall biosynthesis|nr:hypothetical protein [Thermoleophilaceae bacterium]